MLDRLSNRLIDINNLSDTIYPFVLFVVRLHKI